MIKKIIQVTSIFVLAGFSFFYTEKVTKMARNSDPIMIKINEAKNDIEGSNIDPIINNDEYTAGISGCTVDVDKSYSKMKSIGKYDEDLLVMNEVKTEKISKNKYIVSGNKKSKNISIIFLIDKNLNNELVNYLNTKKINSNFFVSSDYLNKNSSTIKELAKTNNIYYYGNNGVYSEKNIIYNNNIINVNSKNESKYCLTNKKNDELLKTCSSYDMNTIKANYISENILYYVKNNISNGAILVFDTNKTSDIIVSINYILSKGYNIQTLDKLLLSNNNCK